MTTVFLKILIESGLSGPKVASEAAEVAVSEVAETATSDGATTTSAEWSAV